MPAASAPEFIQDTLTKLFRNSTQRSVDELLHPLRSIKSTAELECMKEAANISSNVYREIMGKRFEKEAEMSAEFNYRFCIGGCDRSAYVPVVAGGKVSNQFLKMLNAITLSFINKEEWLDYPLHN